MSIVNNRADRRAASDRIDRMKTSIQDIQLDIDGVFLSFPLPSVDIMRRLAEIDVHLSRALVELGDAQRRILNLA